MFRIHTCCNHILIAAEGLRGRRQFHHNGNIFITVPLPTIIVRHWFVRINVRGGFPNDKLILRMFAPSRNAAIEGGRFSHPAFFSLKHPHTGTHRRPPHGTVRKRHSTITRHQEDKLSKATSSLFPIRIIAILE